MPIYAVANLLINVSARAGDRSGSDAQQHPSQKGRTVSGGRPRSHLRSGGHRRSHCRCGSGVASRARQVIELYGKLGTAGWVDLHLHVFEWTTTFGLPPDDAGVLRDRWFESISLHQRV